MESRFAKLTPLLRENDVQSYCVVPLTTALRRLGAMGFGSMHRRTYRQAEINFMQHVAKQIAVAVDNVLHDESARSAQQQLTHERDRVRLLLEVNNAVVSHLSLDELFPAVSVCLRKVIQHDGSLWSFMTRRRVGTESTYCLLPKTSPSSKKEQPIQTARRQRVWQ